MDIKKENQRVAAKHLNRLRAVLDVGSTALLEGQLKEWGIDRHTIQLEQFHQLIVLIKPHQPDITLRLFQSLTLSDFGLYGYACTSAVTLQEAIQHSIKFMPLATARFQEKEEIGMRWVYLYPVVLPIFYEYIIDIDEDFAAGNYRLLEELLGKGIDWSMVEIHFSHNRPDYGQAYDDIFQCKVKFNQPETLIRYPISWLDNAISTNDPSLAEACVTRCFELINESDRHTPCSDKVRRLIIKSRFEITTLDGAAEQLHFMPRTLREYLYREKESFRSLLLEVRMTLARQYLKSTAMSGEEISYLLKYAQPSVFFRAFEKYFGKTTRQLRRSLDSM
jgi:AraC-like DNA-binding protein